MNLLVWLLHEHPEILDRVADAELISLADLVDAADEPPFELDRERLAAIAADVPLGPLLAEGYLRGITGEDWRARAENADVLKQFEAAEWVTFVEGPRGRGLSVPDDAEPSRRVSVFAPVDGKVRRASIEYQRADRPWALSISPGQDCSLPDWGGCVPGECGGGDCQHLRSSEGDKMICWCGPSPGAGRRGGLRSRLLRW